MLARVDALRGAGGAANRVVGGTFHAVGWRWCAPTPRRSACPPSPTVLDAGDAADLLDLVREEEGLATTRPPHAAQAHADRHLQPHGQRAAAALRGRRRGVPVVRGRTSTGSRPCSARTRRASARSGCSTSTTCCSTGGRSRCTRRSGPLLAARFDHVLVDEYQDVNGLQADIVDALVREHRELTCVGDDLQAIYGFRAASAAHMLAFRERLPDAARGHAGAELPLHGAHPASGERRRARRAHRPTRARCAATTPGGEPPELVWCDDEARQADAVADRVLAAREAGVELQRQAVLMRASQHSTLLELELTRRAIPFVKYGGLRYLEAAHVKDFLALLRLVANPRDELSWFRVLQLLEGVGPVRARRVVDRLTRDDVPRGGLAAALLDVGDAAARRRRASRPSRCSARSTPRPATGPLEERVLQGLRAALEPLLEARYADAAVRVGGRRSARGGVRRRGRPRPLRGRAGDRPAVVERRPGPAAASGRGVPGALDRALGEGAGVGRGARAGPVGRALPERHGADEPARAWRRSAASSTSP